MARRDAPIAFEVPRTDFQNRYPISSVAPNCVAIERHHDAVSQLTTLGRKTVCDKSSSPSLTKPVKPATDRKMARLFEPVRPEEELKVYLLLQCRAKSEENRAKSAPHVLAKYMNGCRGT